MKVIMLYRPNTEHESQVMSWAREFKSRTSHDIDMMSLDTREGDDIARLHDIVQYPALLAVADDGSLQKEWQGDTLPLMDEVLYYARSTSLS